MKKLLFLAVLLGLTGCGETDQNDTSQATLQSSPASVNYRMAASQSVMSAPVASFGQWVVNGYTTNGASTVLNANRTIGGVATESKALITPNVSQVSKILRAGLGGFALKFAVDELLDGIDWVMDPANNQIRYKKYIPSSGSYFRVEAGFSAANCSGNDLSFFSTIEEATSRTTSCFQAIGLGTPVCNFITPKLYKCSSGKGLPVEIRFYGTQTEVEETLPLDVVSQKIIDNAQSDNADAQAVTLAAAQAILSEAENDAEKAKTIEDELERNADPKCSTHNAYMNGQARIIEDRYNEMFVDTYDLYNKYFSIKNPLQGVGSWEGHIYRYVQVEQPILRQRILDAVLAGCYETPNAFRWKLKSPPPKPGVHSPG